MDLYVFIPGILGTALKRTHAPGRQVWPPGDELAFQSRTLAQLTSDLEPDGVIENICTKRIYSTVTKMFAQAGAKPLTGGVQSKALLKFGFDWRLSLEIEASRLAQILDDSTRDGDQIVILGHSMGGLLARFLLESPRYVGRPFKARVKRFVAINGALRGAPVMIARALGLEASDFVVWSETPRLLASPPFSGAYMLLPEPGLDHFFDGDRALNLYDPNVYSHMALGGQNMRDAIAFWGEIQAGAHAQGIEYVLGASVVAGQSTIERVTYVAPDWTRVKDTGDGTVPTWSSQGLASSTKPALMPGSHLGVVETPEFRDFFSRHVAALPAATAAPSLSLQPLKSQVRSAGAAQFAVVRGGDLAATEGKLTWTPVDDAGKPVAGAEVTTPVAVGSQPAPVLTVNAPDRTGLYEVRLTLAGQTGRARIGVRPLDEAPGDRPAAPTLPA